MTTPIVVAVDGTPGGAAALAWAVEQAATTGGEVVAVHALGLLDHGRSGETVAVGTHRDEIAACFAEEWTAPLDATAVPSRRVLRDGPPVPVLLAVAREAGAELIVVGSRAHAAAPEALLGSTSTQIAQRATCPVVIVPPDARAR